MVAAMMKGRRNQPTAPEFQLALLLTQVCPVEYRYTGDGRLVIDGMVPDFANVNGKKRVIEVFGDYWHKGEDPQVKIRRYARYGFSCLVIWEHEIRDSPDLVQKIWAFRTEA